MSEEAVPHRMKEIIIQSLNLEGMTPSQIGDDEPLFGEGLGLDSVDALELVVALEKEYSITIESHEVDAKSSRRCRASPPSWRSGSPRRSPFPLHHSSRGRARSTGGGSTSCGHGDGGGERLGLGNGSSLGRASVCGDGDSPFRPLRPLAPTVPRRRPGPGRAAVVVRAAPRLEPTRLLRPLRPFCGSGGRDPGRARHPSRGRGPLLRE